MPRWEIPGLLWYQSRIMELCIEKNIETFQMIYSVNAERNPEIEVEG
jgi:hypothetical protein